MFIYLLQLISVCLLNIISGQIVKKRAHLKFTNPYKPLPDLLHNILPIIPFHIPDYFLIYSIIVVLYNYNVLINVKINLIILIYCFFIRAIFINLTILPSCTPININKDNIYNKYIIGTHDLMFSGHTLLFITFGEILKNCCLIQSYYIQYIGPLLLILARQHYTIDILVSGLIYNYLQQHEYLR